MWLCLYWVITILRGYIIGWLQTLSPLSRPGFEFTLIAEFISIASVSSVHKLVASVHRFHRIKCQLFKILNRPQQKFSSGGGFSTSRVSIFLFLLVSIVRITQRNKNKPGGEGGLFGASLASVQRLVASARRFHGIGCNYFKCHPNQKNSSKVHFPWGDKDVV